MSLREQATRGVGWSVVERWGNQAIGLAIFVVLSRQLDAAAFGLVALAGVVIEFARMFVDQGFSEAVVQRGELDREHLDTAFWTGLATGVLLACGCVALAEPIAAAFDEPRLAPVLRWLSVSFVIGGLSSTQQALLMRSLRFKQIAIRTLAAEVGAGTVAISMALAGYGVWSLVGQSIAAGVCGVIALWSVTEWRPGLGFRWRHFRELSRFGASIVGYKALNLGNQRADSFLIGSFLGTTALGYYTVAWRAFHAITRILTSAMNQVAFPVFSRMQADRERMRRAYSEATQLTALLTFPAFFGLAALAPIIVPAVFGEQWAPSVPVMRVLAGVGLLQTFTHFNGSVIKAVGKPSWRLGLAVIQLVMSAGAILLAVRYGITAVAVATVTVGFALYPAGFWMVRRLIGVETAAYLKLFAAPLLGSALCAAAALGVSHLAREAAAPLRIGAGVGAGAVTYALAIRLLAPELWRRALALVLGFLPGRGRAAAPRP